MKKYFLLGLFLSFTLFSTKTYAVNSFLEASLMAEVEMKAWQAYYEKDVGELFRNVHAMLRLLFHIEDEKATAEIARKFSIAADLFSELPVNTSQTKYNKEILPLLVIAYKQLNESIKENDWDPSLVAEKELAWWISRREEKTKAPEQVADAIEALYHALYGKGDRLHFARAAYLRTIAARYRDLCTIKWEGIHQYDWPIVQAILTQSYKELVLGIYTNKNHSNER